MRVVVPVKLLPTQAEKAALEETLRICNSVSTLISRLAYENKTFARVPLQRLTYQAAKSEGLSAQPALHAIRKVADAYRTLHANVRSGRYGEPGAKGRLAAESKPVVFKKFAAQPFDDRCLSWQYEALTVSIWSAHGRLRGIAYAASKHQRALIEQHRVGESDLVHRDGGWYLHATCEVPEAPSNEALADWIGVDMGIVNIATTSDGKRHSGAETNGYRRRQQRLRQKLQAKGTKSAKRLLKKRRRKETRHATHVNHKISKDIVTEAQRTGCGIAVEDLDGIRDRVRLMKPQRVAMHHQWAFRQLCLFLEYKARRGGVPFQKVSPAYTSQMCSECGHTEKANRVDQAIFKCRVCGVVAHADENAAVNIRRRGAASWAEVNLPYAA
jgi:IS605 OrfB family transposase